MNEYKVNRFSLEKAHQLRQNIQNNKDSDWASILYTYFKDPKNIVMFAYIVLPKRFFRPFKTIHYEFLDFLQIGFKHKAHKGAKLPRGFGKSTIATGLGCIYEICYQIHDYILINSYDQKLSIQKLNLIREELESNEIIHYIYGNPQQDKEEWNKTCFVAFNKVRVESISTGQTARGFLWRHTRPTKIVSDDILTDKEIHNPEIRQSTQDWYVRALKQTLMPKGVMEFVNTPLHPDDLIETIFKKQDKFSDWETFHRRALIDGKSIDEDWLSTEHLLALSRQDNLTFAQEYQGEPVSVIHGLIEKTDLRFYEYLDINQFDNIYIHADTTHTGKTTSDYFCLVAMGENTRDKNFYILDFILDKLDPEKQARQLITMYSKFGRKVKKITFDEKANQGFGYWTKELAKKEYNISLPLQELKYNLDKIHHFTPHIPHFKANRVYFPSNHSQLQIALDQLLAFPSKGINDDFVDGLSGCLDNFVQEEVIITIPDYEENDFYTAV